MRERIGRIQDVLKETGADWAVLTGPDSVCYGTGHEVSIEAGPSPFAGGPAVAFVGRNGEVGLVLPSHEAVAAPAFATVQTYESAAWDEAQDRVGNYRVAIIELARKLDVSGRLGVEQTSFTRLLDEALELPVVPIDAALARTRMIKTADELSRLQRAAGIAAIGQDAARRLSVAGKSELEIFAAVRGEMEHAAGARCPVTGDFLSGVERTAGMGGWPVGRILEPSDPVISDLAPRVGGYWGDSCGSFVLDRPTERYLAMFEAARLALKTAGAEIRPGVGISALDAKLREAVNARGFHYPHHSGHSIGTSVLEYPRVVPFETATIQRDMVLMIEPGAYLPDVGGVRLEWMFRVTATGAEPMVPFPMAASLEGSPPR